MIPIADENPRGFIPFVNYSLLTLNIAVFFFWQQNTETFFQKFGLIPSHLIQLPLALQEYFTVISSMFLHGGLAHLFGNMLYLWIFGDNIEYIIGHRRYLLFYLTVGAGAALAQILFDPASSVPMVGASGAISGVLGAYLLKFPRNRVSVLFFFIFIVRIVRVPALIVLSFWFLMQLFNSYAGGGSEAGGVAWFSHIGGFVSGFVLIKVFELIPKRR